MQAFLFDTVDSTNNVARQLMQEGKISGTAYVLAREQTLGRGTRGRSWISPKDAGLYLSVLDQPRIPSTTDLPRFTQAAAIACAEILKSFFKVDVRIKPVNDLYAKQRKLGGILTEAIIEQNELRALITGIGINLRRADRPIPADQVQPISLEDVLQAREMEKLELPNLAVSLAHSVLKWNSIAARGDQTILQSAWNNFCNDRTSTTPMAADRQ